MVRSLTGLLLAGWTAFAVAGTPSPQAQAEVDQLLQIVGSSACEFYRNGEWHQASEAQAHLKKKYDYLVTMHWVKSTEQFIERAGTKSSMSGETYQIRCPGHDAEPSAQWLSEKLVLIRAPAKQ
jgi:hypothetical protein